MDEWVILKNRVRCMKRLCCVFVVDHESFSKMFLSVGARVIRLRLTLGIS
jgi:hypothetical protein